MGMTGVGQKMREVPALDSTRNTIRAWTIQRTACWEQFQKRGILRGDGRRVDPYFRPAYRWLITQMGRRLPGCEGVYPVWFWYSPKPDLRHGAHLSRGERGVRIELELPRARVLLLDFETWHCVLNRWHLSCSGRESREWDRKTKGFDRFRVHLPPVLEAELRSTWERVFDFELLRRAKMWGPIDKIQGVTDYILSEEVRHVKQFIGR
jgi:hypothetical protein